MQVFPSSLITEMDALRSAAREDASIAACPGEDVSEQLTGVRWPQKGASWTS